MSGSTVNPVIFYNTRRAALSNPFFLGGLYQQSLASSDSAFLVLQGSNSLMTPWTVACQAPLFMGFPRQEYWSGLSFTPPAGLPHPGIEPASPSLPGRFFTTEPLKVNVTQSYLTLCNPLDCPWNSLGQNTGVGSLFLFQGVFPTQGLNPGPHTAGRFFTS